MKEAVTLLVVLLSNQGHWFGGAEGTVNIDWAVRAKMPRTVVVWHLNYGQTELKSGRLNMDSNGKQAELTFELPEVRVPTSMQFHYRLETIADKKVLSKGTLPIRVYPDNLLKRTAARLGSHRLLVWDNADGIPAALERFAIPHRQINSSSELSFSKNHIVLIGQDQIPNQQFAQSALLDIAKSGGNVLILCHQHLPSLVGYPVVRRAAPKKLTWNDDHPLSTHFQTIDPSGSDTDLWAVRLPADEPALEIVYWPREQPGKRPVPIDALLLTKTIGMGRIVLCQIPLGNWQKDPRAQIFLADALEYMASRPEPTRPPSQRPKQLKQIPVTNTQ